MNITKTTFENLEAIEITTKTLRMIVITEFGPRIAWFSLLDEDNILYWEPKKHLRKEWDLRGGHRVWLTRPGADEAEETYRPDNERCTTTIERGSVSVISPIDPITNLQRGIHLEMITPSQINVTNIIINHSELLFSGGAWAVTCTAPNNTTEYIIPIGDKSTWDCFNIVMFNHWGGHGQGGFNDPQFSWSDDAYLIKPQGVENKRMIQAPQGIIAMTDPARDLTFAKKVVYDPQLNYPKNTNIAIYIGPHNFMVEMETMGPTQSIKPNKNIMHTEAWTLRKGAIATNDTKSLSKLL